MVGKQQKQSKIEEIKITAQIRNNNSWNLESTGIENEIKSSYCRNLKKKTEDYHNLQQSPRERDGGRRNLQLIFYNTVFRGQYGNTKAKRGMSILITLYETYDERITIININIYKQPTIEIYAVNSNASRGINEEF